MSSQNRQGPGLLFSFSVVFASVLTVLVLIFMFLTGENGILDRFGGEAGEDGPPSVTEKTPEEILAEKRETLARYEEILASPYMMLVDRTHELNPSYVPVLVEYQKGIHLQEEARDALKRFMQAVKDAGITATVYEGYRSAEEQEALYEACKQSLMAAGYTDTETIRLLAGRMVALPWYSEHQTGLAVDIAEREGMTATEAAQTAFYAFAKEHCAEYGFVLTCTEKNMSVTGYEFKPWHFRYVGDTEVAAYLMEGDIALGSYLSYLQSAVTALRAEIDAYQP